jgi:alanyl-tRNA synthetase
VGNELLAGHDEFRRQIVWRNHPGTHILNFALWKVLGKEVEQQGSLIAPEELQFNFSHKASAMDVQLERIEEILGRYTKDGKLAFALYVTLPTAQQIEEVRAVFGETYPDPVRVLSTGMPVDKLVSESASKDWCNYSIEFCGGTHVKQTSTVKELTVLEESSNAKGIRRIVAVTGQDAMEAGSTAITLIRTKERRNCTCMSPSSQILQLSYISLD